MSKSNEPIALEPADLLEVLARLLAAAAGTEGGAVWVIPSHDPRRGLLVELRGPTSQDATVYAVSLEALLRHALDLREHAKDLAKIKEQLRRHVEPVLDRLLREVASAYERIVQKDRRARTP